MAKKYHPDTNKDSSAKDIFSDAQSAYELLNDPQKKAAWDQYGPAAFDQSYGANNTQGSGGSPFGGTAGYGSGFGGQGGFSGASGFNSDFSFEDLFNAFGGRGRRSRGSGGSPFAQEEILMGENIEVQTNISFMDAAKGTSKDVFITPLVQCRTCTGHGLKKGYKRDTCKVCGGTGTQVHIAQAGFQMATNCSACGGQGITIPKGGECNTCQGSGVIREKRTVNIDIPGGVEDGMRLRIRGEGDSPPTGHAINPDSRSQKGDLYVFIRVATDTKFSRSGSDILYTASIPITTAVLGGEITVPTLDGEVKVRVSTGTGTGDRITLSGMGMSKLTGKRSGKGDLKVEFKVQMPRFLSANQRAIMEMLANEMGDKSAKRVTDFGTTAQRSNMVQHREQNPQSDPTTTDADVNRHKDEGFIKRAWHNMTGLHTQSNKPAEGERSGFTAGEQGKVEDKKDVEPKKAFGAG